MLRRGPSTSHNSCNFGCQTVQFCVASHRRRSKKPRFSFVRMSAPTIDAPPLRIRSESPVSALCAVVWSVFSLLNFWVPRALPWQVASRANQHRFALRPGCLCRHANLRGANAPPLWLCRINTASRPEGIKRALVDRRLRPSLMGQKRESHWFYHGGEYRNRTGVHGFARIRVSLFSLKILLRFAP